MNYRIPGELTESGGWRKFRQEFEIFVIASGNNDKEDTVKIALLLNVGGEFLISTYNELKLSSKKSFQKVLDALASHFSPQTNVVFERYKFFQMKQDLGEPIEHFVQRLRKQADLCKFTDDSLLRDIFVIGIQNMDVKKRLLDTVDLTLPKAIDVAKKATELARELSIMADDTSMKIEVVESSGSCKYCGLTHSKGKCPAYNKTCKYCNKPNHFEKVCMRKKYNEGSQNVIQANQSSSNQVVHNLTQDQNEFVLDEIVMQVGAIEWNILATIQNHPITFKIDSGAQCNVMPVQVLEKTVPKDFRENLEVCEKQLYAYGNTPLKVLGSIVLPVTIKDKSRQIRFVVVETGCEKTILGLNTCVHLNLIRRIDSPQA
uniref:Uncharacterized protein n=1 Tax=Cacopsylla melanoneura TaxID=428564 RepID=A0A8D8LDG3_9HEMI